MWNEDWLVQVVFNHRQYVHLEVLDVYIGKFFLTIVYGSPNSKHMMDLWNDLSSISDTMCSPWVVGGDFNAILKKEEKKGGSSICGQRFKKFGTWIRDCNMKDMGFIVQDLHGEEE